MKAIRVNQYGGPEVLTLEEIPTPQPGPGQVLLKVEAIGINFIDMYQRMGAYRTPLPFTAGNEAAGVVEAVGEGVSDFSVGDRVAYANVLGSYAEYVVLPADRVVPVPDGTSSELAAALMLQGMTAHYLVHSTYPLKDGETCLIHAAAGGVGLLLVQMAKMRGARVIGTVSTEEKAEMARAAGADEVILYTEKDFVAEVKRLTDGQGVEVVYDSVGKTTFDGSMDCLKMRGYLVLFGQSSGAVAPVDPQVLNRKGGIFLTRPSLAHYTASREELLWRARDVLNWAGDGSLKVHIEAREPLAQAAEAQRRIEARKTTGKTLLIP